MSWTNDINVWSTLFELKKDDEVLGIKGDIFFAYDVAKDLSTGQFKTVISPPSFNGTHLGKGIASLFILTNNELENKFTLIEKTFEQLEKEKQEKYVTKKMNKGLIL